MAHGETMNTHIDAIYIINHLSVMLRTSQIHTPDNTAVTTAIDKFVSLINNLINEGHDINLELRGDYFYFNDSRIRYSPEHILNYDYLIKEFKKIGIGNILIQRKITPEDIKVIVKSINESYSLTDPFESIADTVSALSNIKIKKIQEIVTEDTTDARKTAKKIYFNTVSYIKNLFNTVKSGERVNLKKAKRAIRLIVDNIFKQEQILLGMTAIKDYDEYTFHHSTNVSILSIALGQRLGLDRKSLIELGIVSLFHDLGKVDVPHEILNKPTKLNDFEWDIIKKHPKWGVRSILKMRNLDTLTIKAAIVAYEHHINFDLSGYPLLINPQETDLFSKIVIISDSYDAMTSARVYTREIFLPDKALKIMMDLVGHKFDPLLFKFFVNLIGTYPVGTLVMLDSKELGLVFENNQLSLSRPRVMLITDHKGNWIEGDIVDLSEQNGSGEYIRTIVKTMNPQQYNINIADYLL